MTRPTSTISVHQLSLYNPGRMSPAQVIAAFAVRRQQCDRIVADLAAEKPKSRAQHHLVVGQRGMGKTMLLARIAAELRTNTELATRFIPLVFAEEQYAVDRLSKFWLNCLDSLADARELAKDNEGVSEIDATVARLTAVEMRAVKDDQPVANEIYEALIRMTKASGQRLVLLVDNLQLVFDRLDNAQQHNLRELLMRPGSPILVGASPSPPPQSQEYGAAFYDHFKVHYLRPLDESEMRDLLVHLADASQRDDVRQRVLQHPERLTVLRQLTGGNPRTAVTLFFLYAEDFAPSVFGDLEGLLDRVTPLYKARFEELTTQQQVVCSAIANHWDPVTAAKLAASTGLPAGTISAQIDRLEKTGFVERTELFGDASYGYQLAERFFNIWFLMRSASRRQRREVEFLTRFLQSFYEPAERARFARHLMCEDHLAPDRYVWTRAVAASLKEAETAEDLTRHAELTALHEEAREASARLREIIDFDSLPPATLAFDDLRKKLMALVPRDADVTPEDFAKAVLGDRAMFMSGEREQLAVRATKLNHAEIQTVMSTARTTRASVEQSYSPDAVAWFSERLANGQIRSLRDAEDWNRAFHHAADKHSIQLMVDSMPRGFGSTITDSSLTRISSMLIPTVTDTARHWSDWGNNLVQLARFADAEPAYRESIARDPKDPWVWIRMGDLFQDHLSRFAEAETAYREAIARDPKLAWPWINLGSLFKDHLKRYAEAETAYREAILRDPKDEWPWLFLGDLFGDQLRRYADAETAYREAILRDPKSAWSWKRLIDLYGNHIDRPSDAAEACDNALRLDPTDEGIHQNRLFVRRDFMGEGPGARVLLDGLRALPHHECPDTTHLQEALFAAYDSNWGMACEALAKALALRPDGFSSRNTDDWFRASAVLLHLNYGSELVAFLDQSGDAARLRPWVEAVRAHHLGDRRALQNIAPEIRTAAESLYDGIESRLNRLPESTRRRPLVQPKRTRAKRRRQAG